MSKRSVAELFNDVLGIDLGLGSISAMEATVSMALEDPMAAARAYVRAQEVVHADETGWRESRTKAWLWTVATPLVTVFKISRSRGRDVSRRLLGEQFKGISVSDRWTGYSWIRLNHRQICWAHLKRDFQGFVDRGGRGARIGEKLLEQVDLLFEVWHRLRDGEVGWRQFREEMKPVERRIGRLLRDGKRHTEAKTAGMCKAILQIELALWTFTRRKRVDPVNNAAERALRPAVIWRKGSFGTHSAQGSRFAERVLTAATTLKQQGRNAWRYLTEACEAALHQCPAPSLLPC